MRLHGVDIGPVEQVFVSIGIIRTDAFDQIVLPHHARARFRLLRHRRGRRDRDLAGCGLHWPGTAPPIRHPITAFFHRTRTGPAVTYLMRFRTAMHAARAAKRFNFAWASGYPTPTPETRRSGESADFCRAGQGRIVTAKLSTKAKARTDVRAFDRSGSLGRFGMFRITRPLRAALPAAPGLPDP